MGLEYETGIAGVSARGRRRPLTRPPPALLPRVIRGRIPPLAIGVYGVLATAAVGYLTAQNAEAEPHGIAVLIRVLILASFTLAATYAQTGPMQRPMGFLLAGTTIFCSLWLLNGSRSPFAFSVGVLLSGGPAVVLGYYILVVHPTGVLRWRPGVQLLASLAGAFVLLWTVATLISPEPLLRTPLLACTPHCPKNAFFLGTPINAALPALRTVLRVVWATLTVGLVVLAERRWRSASAPVRRSLFFVRTVSWLVAVLLAAFFVAQAVGARGPANGLGAAYVFMWVAGPLAIFGGLAAERLYMGEALAGVVGRLANDENADPAALMAEMLHDPTLSIAYNRPATGDYVDYSGAPVPRPGSVEAQDVVWLERNSRPVGAVLYDRELGDQRSFIHAAADAAFMRLEQARLLADLRASTADLAASRRRVIKAAETERKRIERDLHDGVQQDLLGLRLKLEVAGETLIEDPARGQRMIAAVGRQLDDVLESLRALARGIYPPLLRDHGLVEAVRSAARRSPVPVTVRAESVGRYGEELEVAVYFCCLEGLQNVVKHASSPVAASIRLWQDDGALHFEVADSGEGFTPGSSGSGRGLANMRDRIEAVGGTLTITSRQSEGTVVRGRVPAGINAGAG